MREFEWLLARDKRNHTFDEKIRSLAATLREQMAEGRRLNATIEANLKELGHGG